MKWNRSWGPTRRGRSLLVVAVAAGAVVIVVFGAWHGWRAAQAGSAGRAALVRAERELGRRDVDAARSTLGRAEGHFRRMRDELGALGPLRTVARFTPFVRIQLRGADTLAEAGVVLAQAGMDVTDVAGEVLGRSAPDQPLTGALQAVRDIEAALGEGVGALDHAVDRVRSLDGYRLLGPLGEARDELRRRLPTVQRRVTSARDGLGALRIFAGGTGPRRYLVLSQNPDEPRPTGGFIGTYGILGARDGDLAIERFDGIETWTHPRPNATVPAAQAPSPFRLGVAADRQTLGNVNTRPDWPEAARLAMALWEKGGEDPVHGVVSILPAFLERVLRVTGPIAVPVYEETVSAGNVVERLDFHARQGTGPDRKDFVAAVAEATLARVIATPSQRWSDLAAAAGAAFEAREAVAYSTDPAVQAALEARSWHGKLPETVGDFFYNGEFSYAAKNGRGLRRTFDHHAELRADGSAKVTTRIVIANTEPPGTLNRDSLTYLTVYGPVGASLDRAGDTPAALEPAVSGHPAAGWFLSAPPQGETSMTVVWEVPRLVVLKPDGTVVYALRWLRIPDHEGDILNLRVTLPEGWGWRDGPPPERVPLTADVDGEWALRFN